LPVGQIANNAARPLDPGDSFVVTDISTLPLLSLHRIDAYNLIDSGSFQSVSAPTEIAPLDDSQHPIEMRYRPEHKLETRRKIVKDASRRVRAEGLNGAAVSAGMKDAGLTHGGFYKHFGSKDDLLLESLREGFWEIEDILADAAKESPPGEAWKAIVKTYLSLELCDHPERGCPLAALSPELARTDKRMQPQIVAELVNYKGQMLPFMPGQRTTDKERAFFAIFSTMIGAVEIARMLPDRAMREKVLASTRDFLLRSF
jgi:TetR/AcrR family transcriptional repressor of nem operon